MNDKIINEELILAPIGTIINVNKADIDFLFPEVNKIIKVELYCSECKEKRIFMCNDCDKTGFYLNNSGVYKEQGIFRYKHELLIYNFSCELHHSFKLILETLGDGKLIKVGQYPWAMFFSKQINNEILKVLDSNEKEYYMLAIKSHDNNLNIASFVYLRRVFESLISKARDKSVTKFDGMKIKEIIKKLVEENLLNDMLIDTGYNVLYSLLSDGVHNLSENECKVQYELLKSAIEIILEDEMYKMNLEKRKKQIGKLLSNENSNK